MGQTLSQIQAQLTWNGSAQPTVTFDPSGHNAGDVYALPLQVSSPVTATGVCSRTIQTWPKAGTMVSTNSVSGTMPVVAATTSPWGARRDIRIWASELQNGVEARRLRLECRSYGTFAGRSSGFPAGVSAAAEGEAGVGVRAMVCLSTLEDSDWKAGAA